MPGILCVETGYGVEDSKMLRQSIFPSQCINAEMENQRVRGAPSYLHVRSRALLANA